MDSKAIAPGLKRVGFLAIWVQDAILSKPLREHGLGAAIRAKSLSIRVQLATGPRLENVNVELNVVSDQLIRRVNEEQPSLQVLPFVGVLMAGICVNGADTVQMSQRRSIPLVPI